MSIIKRGRHLLLARWSLLIFEYPVLVDLWFEKLLAGLWVNDAAIELLFFLPHHVLVDLGLLSKSLKDLPFLAPDAAQSGFLLLRGIIFVREIGHSGVGDASLRRDTSYGWGFSSLFHNVRGDFFDGVLAYFRVLGDKLWLECALSIVAFCVNMFLSQISVLSVIVQG
jgi:hypothetical protein